MKKMIRFILISVVSVVMLFAGGSLSSAAEEVYSVEINVQYGQTEARTIFDMINNLRANDAWYWNETNTQKVTFSDLQPLSYDYKLEKIAMQRAAEIAISYDHTRPDNTRCFTAYDDEFYYAWNGENIAAGYRTAQAVNTGWEEADELYEGQGHRRNMLNGNFRSVGIGHVKYNGYDYWVEEFSSVKTNTPDNGADDSLRSCAVDVAQSNIRYVSLDNEESYEVAYKNYIDTPHVSASVLLNNTWPGYYYCPIANIVDAKIADNSIARIEGDKLYGDGIGTTDIVFSCLGKSSVSNLKVECVHDYVVAQRIEPDCTNDGEELFVCSICGDTYTESIPALGHTVVVDAAVESTCTETGLTEGSHCELCGTVFVHQYVTPANGHSVVIDAAVEPTCTETGLKEGSHCELCGTVFVRQYIIPAKGHSVAVDAAAEPTCTETGLTVGSHCEVCGTIFVYQYIIPAKGHSVVIDESVEPTYTETGLTEGSHCGVCGEILKPQEIIPSKNHGNIAEVEPTKPSATAPQNVEASVMNIQNVQQNIMNLKNDKDPKGSNFNSLQAKAGKATKNSITVSWKKVNNAKTYYIFCNRCGKTNGKINAYKLVKKTAKLSFKKSRFKKGTYYKFLVVAVDKNGRTVAISKTIHVATKGGKSGNPKKITVTNIKNNKLTIRKGASFTLNTKVTKDSKKATVKNHRAVAYESGDTGVAKVTKNGKITAKKKGTCYIYAYAQNGVAARVRVTVK